MKVNDWDFNIGIVFFRFLWLFLYAVPSSDINNLSIDLLSQTLSNLHDLLGVRVMVFNVIFNNISAISWQSVLLVEETRVPGENQWPSPLKLRVWILLGQVYVIQHYVIKFVSDLRQVGGFLRILRFPPPIKLIATI
jgi:hypothetical protein